MPVAASLKAEVYPNPARSRDIKVAINPVTTGKILVQIVNINGIVLASEQMNMSAGTTSIVNFPGLDLTTGVYLAVIRSENEKMVKRVMVSDGK